MCNQPTLYALAGPWAAIAGKPNGKEFKPGARILRKLALFPLQKRILTAAEGLARKTLLPEGQGKFYEEGQTRPKAPLITSRLKPPQPFAAEFLRGIENLAGRKSD
jgi:hypothetical protein